ncbi:MAG: hypothetical protein ABSD56_12245, partial [Bryobacteraceae bacterium]
AKDGSSTYREADDDDNPLRLQLTETEAAEIFALAEKLGWFSQPLESKLKVAFMGTKTFRFEDGARKQQVSFNFSQVPEAQQLADWFERVAETESRFITLERTAKYDRLGVNQALLQLQISQEHDRLVAAPQFLPLLDRIAKDQRYMNMARERAASLAELLRNPKPAGSQ